MSRKNIVRIVPLMLAASIVVGIAIFWPAKPNTDAAPERRALRPRPKATQKDSVAAVRDAIAGRRTTHSRKSEKPDFGDFLDDLSAGDRKLAVAVQEALDADDFTAVLKAAHSAIKSKSPVVREAAVEALGWYGAEALPELTTLMADPDEDVAQTAISQWELALNEIEESETRAEIAAAVMKTLANKEALETIVCEITNQDDDFVILEVLVGIIEGCDNKAGVEVACEEYERLTGEEWTSIEAANKWLEENYEPPTPDNDDEQDEAAGSESKPNANGDGIATKAL